jgi:hypothetical protein
LSGSTGCLLSDRHYRNWCRLSILGHTFVLQSGICCGHVILLDDHTAYCQRGADIMAMKTVKRLQRKSARHKSCSS